MSFIANVEKFSGIPRGRNTGDFAVMESADAYFIEPLVSGLRVHIHKDGPRIRILDWKYRDSNKVAGAKEIAMDFWEMETPRQAVFDGVISNGRFKCMDVLLYEDEDLTDKPLADRKEYLGKCEFGLSTDVVPHRIINTLSELKCDACIVKPANSTYTPDANEVIDWAVWKSVPEV